MDGIDLTGPQRAALRGVFASLADAFEYVAVFGSRATGAARPGSDVDLVVYGARDERLTGELLSRLEDSDLSVFADVARYEGIRSERFRAQIDRDAIVLFTAAELLQTKEAE